MPLLYQYITVHEIGLQENESVGYSAIFTVCKSVEGTSVGVSQISTFCAKSLAVLFRIQLATNVQLPTSMGGLAGGAIYVGKQVGCNATVF